MIASRFQCIQKLFLLTLFICSSSWAAQDAIVISDKAIVYADQGLTSPLGYVSRGKKIKVGDHPVKRSQIYPIVVSGKLAYIRVQDISTEKGALDPNRLVVERFQQAATRNEKKYRSSLSYFSYATQIALNKDNANITDGDVLSWNGVSLRSEVKILSPLDFQFLLNYMMLAEGKEQFKAVEVGVGLGYRLLEFKRFQLRLDGQLLGIPFANYAFDNDFRVNGYGLSAGAGFNFSYVLGEHWGLEAQAGVYYTNLSGLDAPAPYNSISPSFYGNRLGMGVNYTF